MNLVKVKTKYQITLPVSVREKMAVKIGDVFEASVDKQSITLRPKSLIDKDLQEALDEVKAGKLYGPFKTHASMVEFLHEAVGKYKTKKSKKPNGHKTDA